MHGALTGSRLHALDNFQRRIEARCQYEINFIVRIFEASESGEIVLEATLIPFARTNESGEGRVKTGMRSKPVAHHANPFEPAPKRIEAQGNLQDYENVEG